MKSKFLKMMVLFSIVLFMGSCSDESTSNDGNEMSNSVARLAEQSLDDVLERMQRLADIERKMVSFDLEYNEGVYSESNVRVIDDFESEFDIAFTSGEQTQSGTVVVTCTIGSTSTTTSCPPGQGQGGCVGAATISCLDKGGCATSCRVKAVIAPSA